MEKHNTSRFSPFRAKAGPRATARLAALLLLAALSHAARAEAPPQRIPLETEMQYTDEQNARDWLQGARFGIYLDWTPRVAWDQSAAEAGYLREQIKTAQKSAMATEIRDDQGNPTGYHRWENFNPTLFDAEEWIDLFVESGAQFLVDEIIDEYGWSSFDTPASTYDSAATDWGRDICAELGQAAQGRLPVIWHQRQHGGIDFILAAWTKFKCRYAPHILGYPEFRKESIYHIISRTDIYGKAAAALLVGTCGGDGEHPSREGEYRDQFDQENSDYLTGLLAAQPWLIMGTKFKMKNAPGFRPWIDMGGTSLPNFRKAPAPDDTVAMVYFPQESDLPCWAFGYPENDRDGREFVKLLAMSACRDGNFLVRVAPRPDGGFEPHHAAALRYLGAWLRKFHRSIYSTRCGPYEPGTWGGATRKGNSIFLHILQNSPDGRYDFPALPDSAGIQAVTLLNTGEALDWSNEDGLFTVRIPDALAADRSVPDRVVEIRCRDGYDTLAISADQVDSARFRYTESLCCVETHPEVSAEGWHDAPGVPYDSLYRNAIHGKPEKSLAASLDIKGDARRYWFREKNLPYWMPPDWFEFDSGTCPFSLVRFTVDLGRTETVSEFALCEKGRRIRNWELEYYDEQSAAWKSLYRAENEKMGLFDYRLARPVTARRFRVSMRTETFDTDGTPRRKAPQLRYFRLYNTRYYPDNGPEDDSPWNKWIRNSGLRGTDAEPAADPGADGVANAFAFFHGAPDAFAPLGPLAPVARRESSGAVLSFAKRREAGTEFDCTVEVSRDLQTWTPALDGADGVSVHTETDAFGAGIDRLEYRFSNTPPRFFCRLRLDRR